MKKYSHQAKLISVPCVNVLASWAEWELHKKSIKEILLLDHKTQKGPPFFLPSISDRSLGVPGSILSPRLSQRFMTKGLHR